MKISNSYFIFWLVVVLILLSGVKACVVYKRTSSIADKEVDFSKFHSFTWLADHVDTTNLPYNNEVLRNNIKNNFNESFFERGYSLNKDNPDLLLEMEIIGEKKEYYSTFQSYPLPIYCGIYYGNNYSFPYPYKYHWYQQPYCYPLEYRVQKNEYIESTITLNIYECLSNKLVWFSTAKGDIYNAKNLDKDIKSAVGKIMNAYPIKKTKH